MDYISAVEEAEGKEVRNAGSRAIISHPYSRADLEYRCSCPSRLSRELLHGCLARKWQRAFDEKHPAKAADKQEQELRLGFARSPL